ncbi:MAG: HD domain-containing protein [Clostridiales bacterium]|nr:HD domain-containing protein [Clostridiales bacterium]
MNLTPINKAGGVEGFCIIKSLEKKVTAKGLPYLDLVLTDAHGEMTAKFWDYKEDLHAKYAAGQLIRVRGTLNEYNGIEQLRVEKIRPVVESDEVDINDFVPGAEYSGEAMLAEIYTVVNSFKDEPLKQLITAILDERKDKLLYWPAAFKLHHAMRGGLLYHTLSILRLAQGLCKIYPFVDHDLLFAGVVLHDIAKTQEFEVEDTGIVSGYTTDGNLVGHLVRGAMAVERIGSKLGTPKELMMLLEHMIISHHGEPEFGAAVRPMFLEAEILAQLDMMDARIYAIAQAVEAVDGGEFTVRQWSLDNRKLYNHARGASSEPKANLMDKK